MLQTLWGTVWRFLQKLNIELPCGPATPLLERPKKDYEYLGCFHSGGSGAIVIRSWWTFMNTVLRSRKCSSLSRIARSHGISMFNILKSCQAVLQSDSTILQTISNVLASRFSTSCSALTVCLDDSHPSGCEVASLCGSCL